jgi:hypothetical protein
MRKPRSFAKPKVQPSRRKVRDSRGDNVPAPKIVTLASKILRQGYKPTREEIETLAGSILANAPEKDKRK